MTRRTLARPGRPWLLALLGIFLFCFGHAAGAEVRLSLVKRTPLVKPSGRVDQVIPLPSGGFLVRDADFQQEKTQTLEVYDAAGRRARRIGAFGQRPGSYYRLKGIGLSGGTVLVADVIGRVTLFGEQGAFLGTKLVQAPGFQIDGIAVDPERGFFYLGGCLPVKTYVDFGCQLVHQYRLKDRKYVRSFLKSDPDAVAKGLTALSDIAVDVDGKGRVVAVDAPSFKLLRVNPQGGGEEAFPIQSRKARPNGKLGESRDLKAVYRSSFLVERVVAAGPWAVAVIDLPGKSGSLLQVFDERGRQVAVDLDPPGKLVGKTAAGNLLFAARKGNGWEIAEHSLAAAPAVKGR